jgi:hypothetical protein
LESIKVDSLDFQFLRLIDEAGQFVEYDMKKELAISEANLAKEMLEQPSKYIYWSSILEKIKMFQESTELQLELLMARLDKQARTSLESEGAKPTKDSVESYIKRQPEYEKARKDCQYYDYIAGRITRIVKAFEQRKDMLQSYGKQIADQKNFGQGAGSRFEDNVNPNPFGK